MHTATRKHLQWPGPFLHRLPTAARTLLLPCCSASCTDGRRAPARCSPARTKVHAPSQLRIRRGPRATAPRRPQAAPPALLTYASRLHSTDAPPLTATRRAPPSPEVIETLALYTMLYFGEKLSVSRAEALYFFFSPFTYKSLYISLFTPTYLLIQRFLRWILCKRFGQALVVCSHSCL